MIDSCYEYDASEEEVCVSPEPRAPRPRLPQHDEARHVLDATEEISAILMQKLGGFQKDLRLYQWEKSRSRDELRNMKNEMMQELCMAKEQMLEELASATMARMEGVKTCLPRPPSEPRPRPPSPRQPGSHAVPGKVTEEVTEDVMEDVTEAAPETEPLQVELPPNAKLASQIAPSRRYMHDKREKDKTRKSGESLQRKVLALGEMCNVFSLTMYWNIVHARMEMAMYVPGGQKIPDLDQVPARPPSSRDTTGSSLPHVEASAEVVFQIKPCQKYGARLGRSTAAIPEAAQC
ncbi:C2H2 finger domain-containing protein [Apiospora aurea]|uniref:C2H2 finger domain-containing protein n=1 Tax=Apiospora aurea TaxID=335848 RepID=A0ABR1PSQ8_9PEZI